MFEWTETSQLQLFSLVNVKKRTVWENRTGNEALRDPHPVGFLETMMFCDD